MAAPSCYAKPPSEVLRVPKEGYSLLLKYIRRTDCWEPRSGRNCDHSTDSPKTQRRKMAFYPKISYFSFDKSLMLLNVLWWLQIKFFMLVGCLTSVSSVFFRINSENPEKNKYSSTLLKSFEAWSYSTKLHKLIARGAKRTTRPSVLIYQYTWLKNKQSEEQDS